MGFRDLKSGFDEHAPVIEQMEPFKKLYLKALFEIAGNLDTLALCARAQVELGEKQAKHLQGIADEICRTETEREKELKAANAPKNARTAKAK